MNIPIKEGVTTSAPSIAVETSDTSIPRKPILVEGGPAPEPITVTPLTVTENGTHDAGENAAYNPVTVNVPAVEPDSKIICNFDFTEEEYDLQRSIITQDPNNDILIYGTYYGNCAYDSTNKVLKFTDKYSGFYPRFYFEPYYNYICEIEYGAFDYQAGAYDRQLLWISDTCQLWYDGHTGSEHLYIENSSGTISLSNYNLTDIANKKLIVSIEYRRALNRDIVADIYLTFEGREKIFAGNLDYGRYNNALIIGRWSSDEGTYNYEVKKIKITQNKINWEVE